MSHLQKIKTGFVDVSSLRVALEAFGWTLVENSRMKTYAGDPKGSEIYDYVAVNPDAHGYDLSFRYNTNRELETYGDYYKGSLVEAFGVGLCNLKKQYSRVVFSNEWEMQGYTVFETVEADGSIVLEAELSV